MHEVNEPAAQPTPRFIKQLVRRRMTVTGEKYTTALRAVKADVDAQYGKK